MSSSIKIATIASCILFQALSVPSSLNVTNINAVKMPKLPHPVLMGNDLSVNFTNNDTKMNEEFYPNSIQQINALSNHVSCPIHMDQIDTASIASAWYGVEFLDDFHPIVPIEITAFHVLFSGNFFSVTQFTVKIISDLISTFTVPLFTETFPLAEVGITGVSGYWQVEMDIDPSFILLPGDYWIVFDWIPKDGSLAIVTNININGHENMLGGSTYVELFVNSDLQMRIIACVVTADPTIDPTIDPTNDPTNDPTRDPTDSSENDSSDEDCCSCCVSFEDADASIFELQPEANTIDKDEPIFVVHWNSNQLVIIAVMIIALMVFYWCYFVSNNTTHEIVVNDGNKDNIV